MTEPGSPEFRDKVRFARGVEECLAEPFLARAPFLALRVSERLLIEKVRLARRRAVRGFVLQGAGLAAAAAAFVIVGAPRVSEPVGAILTSAPAMAAASSFQMALSGPVLALLHAPGLGVVVIPSLLGAVVLFQLRELFSDPLAGLVRRRPR